MYVLGISAYYHDSAATLTLNGEIIAAAQEERFTRKKHDPTFPTQAISYCLKEANISLKNIDAVTFYDKPFLKFERLLETYYNFAPKGFFSFIKAIPVWLKEKLFLKKIILDELEKIEAGTKKEFQENKKLLFSEHHLSHSASAFFPSPFENAAILTIDGVGEWATASISHGEKNKITVLKELHFPHSLGLLYSAFTYYLGFRVNSGEYKLMGLAPYGEPKSPQTKNFIKKIETHLIDLKEDGSLTLNQKYFDYAIGLKMTHNKLWNDLFGFSRRNNESEIEQHHCNLALAIQTVTEDVVLKMAQTAKKLTQCNNLCLAGGVALNCVANGKLLKSKLFEDIWVQPAAGDAGGALGAALATHYIYFDQKRPTTSITKASSLLSTKKNNIDQMQGAYLGPKFSQEETESYLARYCAKAHSYQSTSELCQIVAQHLAEGNVVGWFQGRAEWGPRALGNRSILADARNSEMQKKLNLKIKYRESFRPFAPSVLAEDSQKLFELNTPSPYMLFVAPIHPQIQNKQPENYFQLNLRKRLYYQRSELPAITHLDYSARIQTVHKETNEKYWTLLNEFKALTGKGVLVNTSFNVRGEPIVGSPEDAYRCFLRTEMDILVIGNSIYYKTEQPEKEAPWTKTDQWQEEFQLD